MDDRERLQRYLEWRERTDRPAQRAVRRRRVRGVLVGAAVGAVGFGALALVPYANRHSASLARHDPPADNPARVSDVASSPPLTPPSAPAAPPAPTASAVIDRSPAPPATSAPAVRRTARSTVRTPARGAAVRERVHGQPADESTAPSAAPSARDDSAPARDDAAPTVVIATPSTPSPAADAAPTVTAVPPMPVPAPNTVVVENAPPVEPMLPVTTITPGTVTSITSKRDCERMADCAGGWVKGESREFTDGVKRQVDDFRTGVDRVGRGLQWLGSKLRRSE